ncbi:hypothetical protein V2J09_016163 [Rumex salicifolius]
MEDAIKVFDEMPVRDIVSWNSIISGFLTNSGFGCGFQLFKRMWEVSAVDQASFTTVLSACGALRLFSVLDMVHTMVILSGFEGEVTVGNALITAYFECGCSDKGRQVFNEMRDRNVVTWTAVISGLTQNQLYTDSLKLFREMGDEWVYPNFLTYLCLLSACSGLQAIREGQQIHGLVFKLGVHSDLCIESALMDMYSKCGVMEDTLQVFYSASKVDDVSMTVILAGLAQNGLEEEAILFFVKMVKAGLEIDTNMVSAVLGVFGVDTSLGLGQQIHTIAVKKSFGSNPFVSNGLINMYSKCGNLDEATKIFNKMPQTNSVSWNSMIAAFARHGDGLKALDLFEEMIAMGVEPTDITFLSLLHVCSHVGLIKKGRAGLLEEAKQFINKLPGEPGVLVWQALLGACTIHGDPEMGKYAAEKLFSLTPNSPVPYIQLANIYSSRGKWKERAKTFKKMKEVVGVAKETGISRIEIDKNVHSFVVYDKKHPQSEDIYRLLAGLFRHTRDEGYRPDKRFILFYPGDDEEGSQIEDTNQLNHHLYTGYSYKREQSKKPYGLKEKKRMAASVVELKATWLEPYKADPLSICIWVHNGSAHHHPAAASTQFSEGSHMDCF